MAEKYWDGKNWLLLLVEKKFTLNKNKFKNIYYYHFYNKKLHRKDGPAEISYYENGNKISLEKYYINGNLHRENGPAIIYYFIDGSIRSKLYYFNGIEFKPEELSFEMPIDTEEKKLYIKLKYGG